MLAAKADCTPFLSTDLRVARTSLALLSTNSALRKYLILDSVVLHSLIDWVQKNAGYC